MSQDELPHDGHSASPELFPDERPVEHGPVQTELLPGDGFIGFEHPTARINGHPERLERWTEQELMNGIHHASERLGAARADATLLQVELDKRVEAKTPKPETPAEWFMRLAALQQGEAEPPETPEPREPV